MAKQRVRGKNHAATKAHAAIVPISQRGGNDGSHCTADMPINSASAQAMAPGYVNCFTIPATLTQAYEQVCKAQAQRNDRLTP
jgi:hypothetical protein